MGRHGPERARYDGQTWRRLGRRLLRIAGCHETADICPARTPLFYTQHGWVVTTLLCVKTYLCIHAPFPFRPRITRFPPNYNSLLFFRWPVSFLRWTFTLGARGWVIV